jgi:hypothetical protein
LDAARLSAAVSLAALAESAEQKSEALAALDRAVKAAGSVDEPLAGAARDARRRLTGSR